MKKKILGIASIFAIAIFAVLSISVTQNKDQENDLLLIYLGNVALADGEYAGWDNFWQGQGFYKDESSIREQCPIYKSNSGSGSASGSYGGASGSASGSGSSTQINPSSRTDVRCTAGGENCTPIEC